MQLKIETRDPQHLKQLQPALKLVPELPDASEEFLALASGIKKAGFIRPILIDEDGRIIDDHSRNQARVARRWQLKAAPVQVCRSEDAALLRIHSLCHVRHLSKGAQIYLCVDDALEMIEQSKRDVIAWHKSQRPEGAGSVRPEGGRAPEVLTQDEICEMFKWAKRMFERAIEVKKIFQDGRKYSWNVTGGAADGEVFEGTAREWFLPKLVPAFSGWAASSPVTRPRGKTRTPTSSIPGTRTSLNYSLVHLAARPSGSFVRGTPCRRTKNGWRASRSRRSEERR